MPQNLSISQYHSSFCVSCDSKSICTLWPRLPSIALAYEVPIVYAHSTVTHTHTHAHIAFECFIRCWCCLLSNPIFSAISQAHFPSKCKALGIIFRLNRMFHFHIYYSYHVCKQKKEVRVFFLPEFSICCMNTARISMNDVFSFSKSSLNFFSLVFGKGKPVSERKENECVRERGGEKI